jgi:hypothetical protein
VFLEFHFGGSAFIFWGFLIFVYGASGFCFLDKKFGFVLKWDCTMMMDFLITENLVV